MNDTEPDRKFDLHIKPEVPNPARQFVGLLLGFGVSVGIGLAPLLGRVNVPLFSSLLTLMPESLQNRLIVLSTTVMSVMSVAVQFYAGVKVTTERLERLFKRTLIYRVVS